MAFVTNNHKLGSLTNTNLLPSSSVGQKSYTGFTGGKSRCWHDFLFGGYRENSVLCPFQRLEAAHTSWFMFLFIYPQIQQCSIFKYPSILTSISITSFSNGCSHLFHKVRAHQDDPRYSSHLRIFSCIYSQYIELLPQWPIVVCTGFFQQVFSFKFL